MTTRRDAACCNEGLPLGYAVAKERPILMSGAMVRALLDGRKTQTRRIVKNVVDSCINDVDGLPSRLDIAPKNWDICPHGQPGNRLWVRETWRIGAWNEDGGEIAVDYLADNHSRREWLQVPEADDFEKYWLQSCDECNWAGVKTDEAGKYHWEPGQSPCRTRPSIFMPRWASRILLEIVSVRVERLQDISCADAKAEGIERSRDGMMWCDYISASHAQINPIDSYRTLWESINGPGSWDANPWVWVIEFKRVLP